MVGVCFGGLEGWACSMAYLTMALLFFIAAILRRQIVDNLDLNFNMITATALGIGVFVVVRIITESSRWSFIGGLIGVIVGGFIGILLPDFGSDGD